MERGTCGVGIDLFLCPLRIRQHYRARFGDVHSIFSGRHGSGSTAVSGCVGVDRLLELECRADALWNDTGANLFRYGIREATDVVEIWIDRFDPEYIGLVNRWPVVVEVAGMVVSKAPFLTFSLPLFLTCL